MRIIGIDPGLATIGIGLVEATSAHDMRAVEWLTIETKPQELSIRLQEIATDLSAYLAEAKPDSAVVERLFFATNQKTAIDVAQARGVIMLCLAQAGIPITEITPLQLKQAIAGHGGAEKEQVQEMVKLQLKLTAIPKPDDAADALALAMYGAITKGNL